MPLHHGTFKIVIYRIHIRQAALYIPRLVQGFPEGYTEDCWPVRPPGMQGHACRPCSRAEAEERERLRFALLGNAVTVKVARWLGERLLQLYEYVTTPHPAHPKIVISLLPAHSERGAIAK